MRYLLITLCMLGVMPLTLRAQHDSVPTADSLSLSAAGQSLEGMAGNDIPFVLEDVKSFDGFLLDMGLMNMTAAPMTDFSAYGLKLPSAPKDYSALFRLNTDALYSTGSGTYGYGGALYSLGAYGLLWPSVGSNLQMGSFRLKNGMRLNTYGQYNKEGWRMPNHSALPWERNRFHGAFELKSANGAFGIRVEVSNGR